MDDSLLSRLYRTVEAEVEEENLQSIPRGLYMELALHVKHLRESQSQGDENVIAKLAEKELQLIEELVKRLAETRMSKILSRGKDMYGSSLAPEERYVINLAVQYDKRLEKIVRAISKGQTAFLAKMVDVESRRHVVVRFLKPISAFVDAYGAKYGPFEPESVASIPAANATPLLQQGIVQEVDVEE